METLTSWVEVLWMGVHCLMKFVSASLRWPTPTFVPAISVDAYVFLTVVSAKFCAGKSQSPRHFSYVTSSLFKTNLISKYPKFQPFKDHNHYTIHHYWWNVKKFSHKTKRLSPWYYDAPVFPWEAKSPRCCGARVPTNVEINAHTH